MKRVILPGEALIDRVVKNGLIKEKVGGAPANVAAAIAKNGVEAIFVGTIGKDSNANKIVNVFKENNLSIEGLIKVEAPTTIANVSIDADGERSFTFKRGADEYLSFDHISSGLYKEANVLHLGSATAMLGGELFKTYNRLINVFSNKNRIIVFDPNYRNALFNDKRELFIKRSKNIISKSTIVKLSLEEAEIIFNTKNYKKASALANLLGAKLVLITLGEKGTYYSTNEDSNIIPSVPVKQVDTTGAGDSFIGYLIGELLSADIHNDDLLKSNFKQMIRKANICASITVTKYGALESIPSIQEVKEVAKKNP